MQEKEEHGFYLGKRFDPKQLQLPSKEIMLGHPFHIAPHDLLTHAIILGMTGSGKTVLGKIIIEEAALRGIPSILIDLKGDLASMKLVFPSLKSEDFIPWIETRRGKSKEKIALGLSELYEKKLLVFDTPKKRLEEFNQKTKIVILTPRSTTGVALAISSLPSPPPNVNILIKTEPETILSLIDAVVRTLTMRIFPNEPSEKHRTEEKLLNSIVRYAWENDITLKGTDGLATLVELVENPPMKKIGVMDVDSYISPRERHELAININNLLVGAEQLWHLGIPLDIDLILDFYSKNGETPIIIVSLSEIYSFEDKIFIVSRIAYGVYEWMRRKGGSEEPRLIFYIDEIGGGGGKTAFFPIHPYNTPSKPPLMLLIKQARAFGVSCVFSTQNPGDIDYKGLSNCGTWIIGKLSTARDREKVLQGLGDIELFGKQIDRRKLEKQIASLKTGEFICKTKQGDLEFFKERWLMSYHKTMTPKGIKEITNKRDRISASTTVLLKPTKRAFLKLNHPVSMKEILKHFREGTNIHIEKPECNYMPLLSFRIKTEFKKRHPFLSKELKIDLKYAPILVPLFKDEVDVNYASQVLDLEKIKTEDLLEQIADSTVTTMSKKLTIQDVFEEISQKLRPKIKEDIIGDLENQIGKEKEKKIEAEKKDFEPKLDELDFEKQRVYDQITDLREQISQIELQLRNLEEDKADRLRWGEPVTRISQSISSRQRKIKKHDRQVSKLQRKIRTFDFQKDKLLDSRDRETKHLEEQFNSIQKEIFDDIEPKLTFEDTIEALIPICNADISTEGHKTKKLIQLEWNGYNGTRITTFSCYDCGTRIDTSTPLNLCSICSEVLCEKHAQICAECNKITCRDHSWKCNCRRTHCISEEQTKCQECESLLCTKCKHTCEICDTSLCTKHVYSCSVCEKNVCREHSWACGDCSRILCNNEKAVKCSVDGHSTCSICKLVCDECGKTICTKHSIKCYECGKTLCKKENHYKACMHPKCRSLMCYSCLVTCEGCNKSFCTEHSAKCPNCGKLVCESCIRIKKKFLGLSKKQKCVMCT